jgi:acyl dehydratase
MMDMLKLIDEREKESRTGGACTHGVMLRACMMVLVLRT